MKTLLFIVKILFVIALIAWSVYKFDLATAQNVLRTADIRWGIAALLCNLGVLFFVTLRWKIIIKGFCPDSSARLKDLFNANLLSLFYVLFIPTTLAAEVVRIFKLKAHIGNNYKTATLITALDRILGVATWFLLFMTFPSPFHNNLLWLAFAAALVAAYFLRKRFVFWGHAVLDFSKHHPADIFKAVLFSFIGQLASCFMTYSVIRCLGAHIPVIEAIGLTATTAMAAMIPISMLGIGAKEGSLIALLPLYAVSATQAVMITSFMVFINYFYGLLGGFIELWQSGWNLSKLKLPSNRKDGQTDA
ncbi:MAG: lysylphosphatidylglycerol synthase transmembrane domain-containing protein [Elusimicrobiota bacterium]